MDSNSVTKKKKNDSDRRKRNDLTLEKKIEIIEEIHRSGNVSATARLFNIGRSHAHKLKDQECTIREAYTSGASTRKRLNGSCGGASSTSVSKRKKESTANKHIRGNSHPKFTNLLLFQGLLYYHHVVHKSFVEYFFYKY